MSTTKNKQAPTRAAKRARFASQQEKSGGASPWVLIAGLVIVVALIGGVIFTLTRSPASAAEDTGAVSSLKLEPYPGTSQDLLVKAATVGHDPYPLAVAEDGAVRLPLATFDDQKAHFYTYVHKGRPIEFFVLKSKDGIVRAAFNACDVCFQSKKGYHQEGDEMVCNNCGNRFPSNRINEVRGGCNPSPLGRAVEGDTLVILVEDIVKGLGYF